jgi:hypothetical protein
MRGRVSKIMLLFQQDPVSEGWFRLIIDLIVALSNYAWPAVVLAAIIIFRKPIATFIGKIKKLEAFGVKNELEPAVDELQASVSEVKDQLEEQRQNYTLHAEPGELQIVGGDANLILIKKEEHDAKSGEESEQVKAVLDDTKESPELGLIRLSALLEKESKEVLGSMGFLPRSTRKISGRSAVLELERRELIPSGTAKSLEQFFTVRNEIVHGKRDVPSRELFRVIDIGIDLFKAIKEIQHETHIVGKVIAPIYEDADQLRPREGVVGITILSSSSPDNYLMRSFHTTQIDYYSRGDKVAWEWDFSHIFERSWYQDDDGRVVTINGSVNFIGRKTEDL